MTTPNNAMTDALFRRDVLGRYLRISAERRTKTVISFLTDSWVGPDPLRHLFSFNAAILPKP